MNARQRDLLAIYGQDPGRAKNRMRDAQRVMQGIQNSTVSQYGFTPTVVPREDNWYDPISSLMQSSHKTSISSLNDDNREDEKEIELLEEASKITDEQLSRYKDAEDFFTQKHLES